MVRCGGQTNSPLLGEAPGRGHLPHAKQRPLLCLSGQEPSHPGCRWHGGAGPGPGDTGTPPAGARSANAPCHGPSVTAPAGPSPRRLPTPLHGGSKRQLPPSRPGFSFKRILSLINSFEAFRTRYLVASSAPSPVPSFLKAGSPPGREAHVSAPSFIHAVLPASAQGGGAGGSRQLSTTDGGLDAHTAPRHPTTPAMHQEVPTGTTTSSITSTLRAEYDAKFTAHRPSNNH